MKKKVYFNVSSNHNDINTLTQHIIIEDKAITGGTACRCGRGAVFGLRDLRRGAKAPSYPSSAAARQTPDSY